MNLFLKESVRVLTIMTLGVVLYISWIEISKNTLNVVGWLFFCISIFMAFYHVTVLVNIAKYSKQKYFEIMDMISEIDSLFNNRELPPPEQKISELRKIISINAQNDATK